MTARKRSTPGFAGEDPPKARLQWIEVERPPVGESHGVEFAHEDVTSGPVAFIVGYDWLKNPGVNVVSVQIRNSNPPADAMEAEEWKKVVMEVKLAVRRFLARRRRVSNNTKIGKVTVWYNA